MYFLYHVIRQTTKCTDKKFAYVNNFMEINVEGMTHTETERQRRRREKHKKRPWSCRRDDCQISSISIVCQEKQVTQKSVEITCSYIEIYRYIYIRIGLTKIFRPLEKMGYTQKSLYSSFSLYIYRLWWPAYSILCLLEELYMQDSNAYQSGNILIT